MIIALRTGGTPPPAPIVNIIWISWYKQNCFVEGLPNKVSENMRKISRLFCGLNCTDINYADAS